MKMILTMALLAIFLGTLGSLPPADKSTSLLDAQAAIEANLKTPEGKAFDERMGPEFVQKHMGPLHACKQSGNELSNFWLLLKLDKDGAVAELLLYPTTKLGACAREAYLKDKFVAPPLPDYWVGVYLKLSH